MRSIVGRFLEHSRIFYFYAGGEEEVYCASADLMVRNLHRRVEACFPLLDDDLKRRVIDEGLHSYLASPDGAWALNMDGSYERVPHDHDENQTAAQESLLSKWSEI